MRSAALLTTNLFAANDASHVRDVVQLVWRLQGDFVDVLDELLPVDGSCRLPVTPVIGPLIRRHETILGKEKKKKKRKSQRNEQSSRKTNSGRPPRHKQVLLPFGIVERDPILGHESRQAQKAPPIWTCSPSKKVSFSSSSSSFQGLRGDEQNVEKRKTKLTSGSTSLERISSSSAESCVRRSSTSTSSYSPRSLPNSLRFVVVMVTKRT